jgi:hypothetical protein
VDLATKREASAVIAFAEFLREGDINLRLTKVVKLLSDEKNRIRALAKIQRESFVRSVMGIAEISLEDLRPDVGVPEFQGPLH